MTVKKIQLLLLALGYDPGQADNIAGKQTQAAVRAFQRDWGITQDGIAGRDTQGALRKAISDDWQKPENSEALPQEKTGTWWDEIRYFTRSDPYIGCSCGEGGGFPAEPAEKLRRLADAVREDAGRPLVPTSTLRCKAHNAAVGGVWNSRHLLGHAMDFCIPGMTAQQILQLVRAHRETFYSYAIDESHVHMDVL